ncbi:MAG: response regulator [Lachnospiraceae bacterium]|nr:response regulator [Lachnospiraceae bacterium]
MHKEPFGQIKKAAFALFAAIGGIITALSYDRAVCSFAQTKEGTVFHALTPSMVIAVIFLMAITGLIVWKITADTITRKKDEEIRLVKKEADRANSAKYRFLANMSHEIRTPINTIMGMDEMILREDTDGVPRTYVMSVINYALDIRNASESLLGLVNDVLDLSKIESGKMNLAEQEYDIRDLLRQVLPPVRVKSTEKGLTFETDIDSHIPVRLFGDMGKIKQIILNLLTNAVKFTQEGRLVLKVTLAGKEDDLCRLEFSVKDTGIGIKDEDMDKLFTAFERLEDDKNSNIQGIGLGLDISRQFARIMGGELTCLSTYGEGSEFVLRIGQKIVDGTELGEFTEEDEDIDNGPYVPLFAAPDAGVLVVDDNPMNLTVIRNLLSSTGMNIVTVPGGKECLEELEKRSFHVVLLDHMMPGMDGLETIKRIREKEPDLPVIALTANAATSGEEFYKAHGFDGYLAKPVDGKTLERTIIGFLPTELIKEPDENEKISRSKELPDDLKWLNETDGISAKDGIKHSGGAESFVYSLNMFLETIDDNASVIEKAYDERDIKLFTIKVHALKSSARIIGAMELSEHCALLEEAGNKEDLEFINANTPKLLKEYKSFKEKLSRLERPEEEKDKDLKPRISEDELKDAYEALKELCSLMDYDSIEMILNQTSEYSLPEEDDKIFKEIKKAMKIFDWEKMEEILNH